MLLYICYFMTIKLSYFGCELGVVINIIFAHYHIVDHRSLFESDWPFKTPSFNR